MLILIASTVPLQVASHLATSLFGTTLLTKRVVKNLQSHTSASPINKLGNDTEICLSSYLPPEPTLRRLVDTEMLSSSYTEYNTTQGYYKRSTFKSRLESTPIGAELSRQFVYNYRPCVAHLRIRILPCLPVVFSDIYREIATQNSQYHSHIPRRFARIVRSFDCP